MANHKSSIKRIRSSEVKRSANRLQHKTARNAVRDLRNNSNKKEAKKQLPKVVSLLDKFINKSDYKSYNKLLMSSGNFDGYNIGE